MSITISADDPRSIRAIEIAANASHWRVTRDAEGRELFRIPSQSHPVRLYLVTTNSCTCADFVHGNDAVDDAEDAHLCKHILAVRLYSELVRAQSHLAPTTAPRRAHLRVVH